MPTADTIAQPGGKPVDYHEISMNQIAQQILPTPFPKTTVWGYGKGSAEQARPARPQRAVAHDRGELERSFNRDGSLSYPDSRAFFDRIVGDFTPEGEFSPIWNPEFFGNTIMVNGTRLALPHRRTRGQRDDAAIPHRTRSAGPARVNRLEFASIRRQGLRCPASRIRS